MCLLVLHVKLLGVIQGNILHIHLPLEWGKIMHVRVSEKLFPYCLIQLFPCRPMHHMATLRLHRPIRHMLAYIKI